MIMKNLKYITVFYLLFNLNFTNAQSLENTIQIEVKDGENIKKGSGIFFMFELTKEELRYSAILTSKKFIGRSSDICLLFDLKHDGTANSPPYIYTIPNNKNYVIQSLNTNNDLGVIPFGQISNELLKRNIVTQEMFLVQELIPEILNATKSDIIEIKALMEKWIQE